MKLLLVAFLSIFVTVAPVAAAQQEVGSDLTARVAGPATIELGHEVILSFTGTVSSVEPEYDVALAPDGSNVQIIPLYNQDQALTYGIAVPDKSGLYRFAVIASAPDPAKKNQIRRRYAFLDVNVISQSSPLPGPPPVNPTPPPSPNKPPLVTDSYGFYSFSKNLLALMPNTPVKSQAAQISTVFSSMAASLSNYQSAQQFVTDTSTAYKNLLGANYTFWNQYFFAPLKGKLGDSASKGLLPQDVAVHAEVWKEIAAALREVH